jgi:hypothetical protein
MANPTTNFGWVMPTATDLVTDLPADFNVFGQGVDTSMQDLLGGTTGQVLSKTSATNMDFTWVTPTTADITGVTAGTGISGGGTSGDVTITNSMATAIDAKGDLIGGTGADTFSRLAVGANDTVLTADSTAATGLKWAAPTSTAGMTKIHQGAFTAVAAASRTADFTSTYDCYRIIFNITSASNSASTWFRFSSSGTDNTAASYGLYGSPFNPGTGQTKWDFLRAEPNSTQVNYISMDVINPKLTGRTLASGTGVFDDAAGGAGTLYFGGYFDNSTSFDGFSFIVTAGTITGTLAVYGYNK